MGHQFDDFLKNKLEQREFEFKDAYWADALELIEADEKDNRWGFLYWLLLGLLLLAGGTFAFYQWDNQASLASIDQQQTEWDTPNNRVIAQNTPTNTSPTKTTDTPATNRTTNSAVDTQTPINNKKNETQTNIENKVSATTKAERQPPHTEPEPNFETQLPTSTAPSTRKTESETERTSTASSTLVTDDATHVRSNPEPVTEIPSKLANEATHKPSPTKNTVHQSQPTKPLDITNNLLENEPKLTQQHIDQLWKGDSSIPETEWTPNTNPFSFGARASSLLYLSLGGQIGYTFGLTGKYQITPTLAIGTDLLYHIRRHDFNSLDYSTIVEYSFGRTEYREWLAPSALHSIEMPIYAEIGFGQKHKRTNADFSAPKRYNKHSIELGIAPIVLYGAKGVLVDKDTDTILEKGWIQTEAYRSFYANGILGYNYNLQDYFSLGIRARYAFGGIIDQSFDFPTGVTISQPDNLYFDINAKFYLF